MAGNLNAKLGTLTRNSSPGDVRSVAQSAATELNTMSNEFNADAGALGGCPSLGSAGAQTVANAFETLAVATNQTLSILIGEHLIFAQFGVTAPIAASLRNLEAAFDSYTYELITVASAQQSAITDDQNNVDAALGNAVGVYEQICIPSPLYPTVPPVCAAF